MPPKPNHTTAQLKRPADEGRRPSENDASFTHKDKRERGLPGFSTWSTQTGWHGMANAFNPGF